MPGICCETLMVQSVWNTLAARTSCGQHRGNKKRAQEQRRCSRCGGPAVLIRGKSSFEYKRKVFLTSKRLTVSTPHRLTTPLRIDVTSSRPHSSSHNALQYTPCHHSSRKRRSGTLQAPRASVAWRFFRGRGKPVDLSMYVVDFSILHFSRMGHAFNT